MFSSSLRFIFKPMSINEKITQTLTKNTSTELPKWSATIPSDGCGGGEERVARGHSRNKEKEI